MEPARLEAFTDGVIAVIITILVLDLHVPQGHDLASLKGDAPVMFAYLLSYVNVGIFWNNHHHMLHVTERIDGKVLWANLALLFWLSLVPFVIRWIDEAGFAPVPTSLYGMVLFAAAVSYGILEKQIIRVNGSASDLARALGRNRKGKLSTTLYLSATLLALLWPWVAISLYVVVALIWLVPDSRIESLGKSEQ